MHLFTVSTFTDIIQNVSTLQDSSVGKSPLGMQETLVQFLGREGLL